MRKLTFTAYRSCEHGQGSPGSQSWAAWVDDFSYRRERADKDGLCVVLGAVAGQRSKANVTSVHAIGLDLEIPAKVVERGDTIAIGLAAGSVDHARKVLQRFESIEYTTHSHKLPGKGPRYRVIVPLAEPITAAQHAGAWAYLNSMVGGAVDPSTKDASRLHYTPSAPHGAKGHHVVHNKGEWFKYTNDTARVVAPLGIQPAASDEQIKAVQKAMRYTRQGPLKAAQKALLAGAALAPGGERHNAIRDLTWWISERFPALTDADLDALFGESIAAMPGHDLAEARVAYRGGMDRRRAEASAPQRNGAEPYSPEELTAIAAVQECTPADLDKRWVIQKDATFYFLSATGYYRGPFTRYEARTAALGVLKRAPVELNAVGRNGPRRLGIEEVTEVSGDVADKVIADLTAQGTTYDPHLSYIYEAVSPLRKLTPLYDPEIDRWLQALAGDAYPKLLDWLAVVPDTSRLLCALYIAGYPASGKTLLAYGLARIWTTGGGAEIENVLADFNEELAACPLIVADETLPKSWRGHSVTTKLRSIISVMHRTLKRKHRPPADLKGAIRLVLTANNEFLLESDGASSAHDLEAIAQRFLYIDAPKEAADVLAEYPQSTRDRFLSGDGIARHTLWLAANREVVTTGRFAVSGDVTTMHRLLLTGTAWNSQVCEWLVRYLMRPQPLDQRRDGLIRRDTVKGRLLVNDQALIDSWDQYLRTHRDPDTAKIGQALRTIAKTGTVQLRHNGRRIRYREIDLQHLIAWSEQHNIGDEATILGLGEAAKPVPGDTEDLGSLPAANTVPV